MKFLPKINFNSYRVLDRLIIPAGVGNVGTGETDLYVYTLPKNTLNKDSQLIRFDFFGTYANNANLKTIRMRFGATALILSPNATSFTGIFRYSGYIARTSPTAQFAWWRTAMTSGSNESQNQNLSGTAAETMTNDIIIKLTGQSGTASNDILFKAGFFEFLG